MRALALDIKNNVQRATGLNCSIGITPNKLLSKIASDLDKPDGLTLLTLDDLPTRIWPLPARRINGIGPQGQRQAGGAGHAAPSASWRRSRATNWWSASAGATAAGSTTASHGIDERPVVTHSEPVSMSRETTFERDLHAVARPARTSAACSPHWPARWRPTCSARGYAGRTIGIKLRFEDFKTVTRDMTVADPTQDAQAIRHAAGLCLKRVDLTRRIRLLGVRVGTLVKGAAPRG